MNDGIYRCPVTGLHFDPLAVHRKLLTASRGEVNRWLAEYRGEDVQVSLAAEERLVALVREAFRLPGVDAASGGGTPDSDALRVLDFFLTWLNEKKVKGQSSQIESQCADCPRG